MCLSRVIQVDNSNNLQLNQKYFYKVFTLSYNGNLLSPVTHTKFSRRRWITDKKTFSLGDYQTGFHAFLTKDHAMLYLTGENEVIFKVLLQELTAIGSIIHWDKTGYRTEDLQCAVGRKIFILNDIKEIK